MVSLSWLSIIHTATNVTKTISLLQRRTIKHLITRLSGVFCNFNNKYPKPPCKRQKLVKLSCELRMLLRGSTLVSATRTTLVDEPYQRVFRRKFVCFLCFAHHSCLHPPGILHVLDFLIPVLPRFSAFSPLHVSIISGWCLFDRVWVPFQCQVVSLPWFHLGQNPFVLGLCVHRALATIEVRSRFR